MKFCTTTLGCKVNQVETEAVESLLISNGHELKKAGEGCDACVINTCAVTAESVRKSRQAVRRMRKLEPNALIAVCGCLSELEEDDIKALNADIIGGSGDRIAFALELEKKHYERVSSSIVSQDKSKARSDENKAMDSKKAPKTSDPTKRAVFEELPVGTMHMGSGRTRAFLKIEDGCDNYCAYCIIPYARGAVRSLPIERVTEQSKQLQEQGFKEIVITGIEISSYGKDLDSDVTIIDAIREISIAAPETRLRLGSLGPSVFTDKFCKALSKIPNLCNHFHLSLQSGNDETLNRMGRKYDTETVMRTISNLRDLFSNCGITADLIVGFPGETDEEFNRTIEFIQKANFSGMHIFPFSKRARTRAADMPNQIAKTVSRARACTAREVADAMGTAFLSSQIGKTLKVLIEREEQGCWVGHSENYLEVSAKGETKKNELIDVYIEKQENGRLIGEIL